MSWSPAGDRIAYFARTEKKKTLILQNVVTEEDREADRAQDRRRAGVARLQPGRQGGRVLRRCAAPSRDIFIVNLETEEIRNVTNDTFGDYAPTCSPDGKSIVYLARVSGNDKLFRLDLATGKKTQLTFGTHDDGGAQFIDADTIVFPSTAMDPNQPIDPEVARNGNIYNIWTLQPEKEAAS